MQIKFKKLKRIYKILLILMCAWLVIGFVIFIEYPAYLADRIYLRSSYNYTIEEIKFEEGHRGFPYIKVDSNWYLLKVDEMKIVPYILVGDSIVKESGDRTIKVFRKDGNGRLILKEFD